MAKGWRVKQRGVLANIFAGTVSIAATAAAVWWFWWPEPEAKSEARIDAATECEESVSRTLSVIDKLRAQRVAGISKEMLVEDLEVAPPAGLSPEQIAQGRAQGPPRLLLPDPDALPLAL